MDHAYRQHMQRVRHCEVQYIQYKWGTIQNWNRRKPILQLDDLSTSRCLGFRASRESKPFSTRRREARRTKILPTHNGGLIDRVGFYGLGSDQGETKAYFLLSHKLHYTAKNTRFESDTPLLLSLRIMVGKLSTVWTQSKLSETGEKVDVQLRPDKDEDVHSCVSAASACG
ncbi:uncharacterized protein UTRI_04832 [Ustilago trichophora]|uniref:Uncharacterized protein n=1 Tax=Ustilago trichophora TaxID=86804 RepID=A0A5C3EEJ6_9BASI|nr:uncharacterized protein UTRI_04832 [Ustilago trichophora]